MPPEKKALVWLRRNLRVHDNLALAAAAGCGGAVIPVFIREKTLPEGAAMLWWLEHSLIQLQRDLLGLGSKLTLRSGDPLEVLRGFIQETGADAVFWDRSFEPAQRKADARIRMRLTREGIACHEVNDSLLFDPASILNKQGTPFKVFTPFWNHCLSLPGPALPMKSLAKLGAPSRWPSSVPLESFWHGPRAKWAQKFESFWQPGSQGAMGMLRKFLDEKAEHYLSERDCPSVEGTSRLSPHLHFGEISVREVWCEVHKHMASERRPGGVRASEAFLRQLVWREFSNYQLYHFPYTVSKPLRKEFSGFKWSNNARLLRAWKKGMTGYPLVDAGMRQLWETGWMHNRVRMIAASFLVKDLLQPWQKGAAWFLETLLDADLANNTFGWQWVAGCGADAAPYFRIFNPVLQGEKFDPQGAYVRRWVPELCKLPGRFIHAPWRASAEILEKAGIRLGKDYPLPVVDHDAARKRALFVYYRMGKDRGK